MVKIEKFLEYGVYLAVFLLSFQTRWILAPGELSGKYWEYGTISLYVVDIVLVVVLFLWAWYWLRRERRRPSSRLRIPWFWWLLSGWDLMVFISIFAASDHGVALYRYLIFLLGLGLAALLIHTPIKKVKLVYSLVLGLVLQAVLGIGQFLDQFGPACKYLGLARHDPAHLGVSVVETVGADGVARRWLRAYGGLDHPNILGGVLALGIIIFLSFVSRRYGNNRNMRALSYVLTILLAAGLFFTFSRGAGLAVIAGLVVFGVGLAYIRRWSELKIALSVLGVVAVFVAVLAFSYQSIVMTRLSGNTRLENKSNQERISSYARAGSIIKQNPFFGVGVGNYTLALSQTSKDPLTWSYQPVHNTFLLIWAEIGVVGFSFWSALFFIWRFKVCDRAISPIWQF